MVSPTDTISPADTIIEPPVFEAADDLVESDSLVEELSIDGMCGVY
jgi:mycofactocin precursor